MLKRYIYNQFYIQKNPYLNIRVYLLTLIIRFIFINIKIDSAKLILTVDK